MELTVRGKNLEITEALRTYVEKHTGKIQRYFEFRYTVFKKHRNARDLADLVYSHTLHPNPFTFYNLISVFECTTQKAGLHFSHGFRYWVTFIKRLMCLPVIYFSINDLIFWIMSIYMNFDVWAITRDRHSYLCG